MPAARSRVAVIFFTVLIDLIGFGIIIPILPYYAQRLGAGGLGLGALLGVFSAMQFVATAFLGRTSDRVGRRPILLATMLVNALGYMLFAAAHSYPVLFIARVVSGFAGGNISAAQAYMADITTPAERSRGMGMIGAAFGLGFIIGPALGGLSAHYLGPAAPGLVAAVLSLANFVSAYLVLPESLKAEHRSERQLWDFSHIGDAIRHPRLAPLMIAWALAPFAFSGYTVAIPLWANLTFGWREQQLGWFFTVIGVTAAIVQGYGVGKLAYRFGDRLLLIGGGVGGGGAGRPGSGAPLHRGSVRVDGGAGFLEQHLFARRDRAGIGVRRSDGAGDGARRGAGPGGPRPAARAARHGGGVRCVAAGGVSGGGSGDGAGGVGHAASAEDAPGASRTARNAAG